MDRFKGNLTETPSRFRLASGSLPARFRLAAAVALEVEQLPQLQRKQPHQLHQSMMDPQVTRGTF